MTLLCAFLERRNEFAQGGFLGYAYEAGGAATGLFLQVVKHKNRSGGLRVSMEKLHLFPGESIEKKGLIPEAFDAQSGLSQGIYMLQVVP